MSIKDINACIQKKLKESGLEKVSSLDAAQWLDEAGLLKDNPKKLGNALRNHLQNDILGATKEKNRWFIYPLKVKKNKPKVKKPELSVDKLTTLEQCYSLVRDPKAFSKLLDEDPLSLVVKTRDITRVSVMEIAKDAVEDYSDKANMIDTISVLYEKRLIGKISFQCLHMIRKLGNMALYEKEEFEDANSRLVAGMVGNALVIFYEELNRNNLIR